MRGPAITGPVGFIAAIVLTWGGPAFGWSLVEEVSAVQSGLTIELVWELIDTKVYCGSSPPDLDRLSCEVIPDPAESWIGVDAAGNRYGTINGSNTAGEYFDIYRRPAGTHLSQHIVRITRRLEPVFGEVTKLNATGRWELDTTNGTLLIGLTGTCFSAACTAEGDITDHLGLIKISGLPTLFDLQLSYQPEGSLLFNVPARPEGLPQGARLDVYHGDVGTLPDLSAAQPLACDAAPGFPPGGFAQVADTLGDPPQGGVRYYVTTATMGSERRAGRTTQAGVLSGRPAALLPPCP